MSILENPEKNVEEHVNTFEDDVVGTEGGVPEFGKEKRPNLEALKEQRDKYILEAIEKVKKSWLNRLGIRFVPQNIRELGILVRKQIYEDHGIDEAELTNKTHSIGFDEMAQRNINFLIDDIKKPNDDPEDVKQWHELNDTYSLEIIDEALKKYMDETNN